LTQYILRRLVLLVPVVLGITLLSFIVIKILPGDLAVAMIGQEALDKMTPEVIAQIRSDLGLDRPLYVQYLSWLWGAVRGDLGKSLVLKIEILPEILRRFAVTGELAILAVVFGLVAGTPIGVLAATQGGIWDWITRFLTSVGVAVPSFFIATLLLLFVAPHTPWIPVFTYVSLKENPVENLLIMIFPVLSLGSGMAMVIAENTRSAVLDVLGQDYVMVARAKGLRERAIMWSHVLKNASIPVISIVGLQMGFLFSGTIIIETIFSLPGMGKLVMNGINLRDYVVVQGVLLFTAVAVVVINLLTDIAYAYADPRIHYE
jgi:peptide/nickel transport system permease protein